MIRDVLDASLLNASAVKVSRVVVQGRGLLKLERNKNINMLVGKLRLKVSVLSGLREKSEGARDSK